MTKSLVKLYRVFSHHCLSASDKYIFFNVEIIYSTVQKFQAGMGTMLESKTAFKNSVLRSINSLFLAINKTQSEWGLDKGWTRGEDLPS